MSKAQCANIFKEAHLPACFGYIWHSQADFLNIGVPIWQLARSKTLALCMFLMLENYFEGRKTKKCIAM